MRHLLFLAILSLCTSSLVWAKGPAPSWRHVDAQAEHWAQMQKAVDPMALFMIEPPKIYAQDHKIHQWTQGVIDQLWAYLANKYDLSNIPKPIPNIIENIEPKAFVSSLYKCHRIIHKAPTRKKHSRESSEKKYPYVLFFHDDPKGFVDLTPQLKSKMPYKDSRNRKDYPCVMSDRYEDLEAFVNFFQIKNQNSQCSLNLQMNTSPPTLETSGDCFYDRGEQITQIGYNSTSNVIHIHSGIFKHFNFSPQYTFSFIAHEIAHYFKAHAGYGGKTEFSGNFYQDLDYLQWQNEDTGKPVADMILEQNEINLISEKLMSFGAIPYADPLFLEAPLDPAMSKNIEAFGRLLRLGDTSYLDDGEGYKLEDSCRPIASEQPTGYSRNLWAGEPIPDCVKKCTVFEAQVRDRPLSKLVKSHGPNNAATKHDLTQLVNFQNSFLDCLESLPRHDLEKLQDSHYTTKVVKEDAYRLIRPLAAYSLRAYSFGNLYSGLVARIKSEESDSIEVVLQKVNDYYRDARHTIQQANRYALRTHTHEEEADNLTVLWLAEMGLGSTTLENAFMSFFATIADLNRIYQDEVSQALHHFGEISYKQCKSHRDSQWQDNYGGDIYIPIHDYEDPHHPACYRIFRLAKFRKNKLPALLNTAHKTSMDIRRADYVKAVRALDSKYKAIDSWENFVDGIFQKLVH